MQKESNVCQHCGSEPTEPIVKYIPRMMEDPFSVEAFDAEVIGYEDFCPGCDYAYQEHLAGQADAHKRHEDFDGDLPF